MPAQHRYGSGLFGGVGFADGDEVECAVAVPIGELEVEARRGVGEGTGGEDFFDCGEVRGTGEDGDEDALKY